MIGRRAALAGGAALALPSAARPQGRSLLRMVPQANLTSLDPIWSTANITRNHGYMVYDTLYGLTAGLEPTPQMAAGHLLEDGGLRATITLRDGRAICEDMQRTVMDEVAWVPVGAYKSNTAVRRNLVDRVNGFAIFWGVRPA